MNDSPSEPQVQRFIRDSRTGLFLGSGGWTSDRREARDFSDLLEVLELGRHMDLTDCVLLLRNAQAEYEVNLKQYTLPMRPGT